MTVSTTASTITVAATGANSYAFPFIGVAASDIIAAYTNTLGILTPLSSGSYSVSINSPAVGEIWGVGGSVSPVSPSSYASGSLTISRILPLTQTAEISNQGNEYPIVTEQALDTLCMEIQQVSARGGAYRGTWVSGAIFNFGDITQDGINGAFTNNIYICAQANTSGVWATDLANGYWSLVLNIQTLNSGGSYLPLSGGTINGNFGVTGNSLLAALTASGASVLNGAVSGTGITNLLTPYATLVNPVFTGHVTVPTPTSGTDAVNKTYADALNNLPSQTGNGGKLLTTNGTTASWGYPPGISLYQSIGTGLTGATWGSIGFNQEEYKDVASWHSNSTNTSRLTVDFTGRLRLTGTVDFGTAGNATYALRFLKNGATVIKDGDNNNGTGGIANIVRQIVLECPCASGDYFELQAQTNVSSTTTGTGISQTSLQAQRIN